MTRLEYIEHLLKDGFEVLFQSSSAITTEKHNGEPYVITFEHNIILYRDAERVEFLWQDSFHHTNEVDLLAKYPNGR